jgi:D-alanyl-D-alanine carboxypeptidase
VLKPSELLAAAPAPSEPIAVYTGPTKTGAALIAAVAGDTAQQTPRHAKKSRVAAKKPDSAADSEENGKDAKPDSKSAVKHAHAKPGTRPKAAEKPVSATEKSAAKPAKPKAAVKPSTKPKSTTSEAKPAGQGIAAAPRS